MAKTWMTAAGQNGIPAAFIVKFALLNFTSPWRHCLRHWSLVIMHPESTFRQCSRLLFLGRDAKSLMPLELFLSPQGHLHAREAAGPDGTALDGPAGKRIHAAFTDGSARGLLHLATTELQSSLPPPFAYARDFARLYLTRLCQTPTDGESGTPPPVAPPSETDLAFQVLQAPPMLGCEYLSPEVLSAWWSELDTLVRNEIEHHAGGVQAYLSERSPQWRLVGRVTLHLAENKRDPEHPFAFLATYIPKLSAQGRVQHEPLGKALHEYAGAKNRSALLSLLVPIQRATERSPLIKEMVESGEIYHPLAWSPREAYRFLQDIPIFEESGLVVRVPDWWKPSHPPRPVVNVKIDGRKGTTLSVDALLDFSVNVTLDGEPLTEAELERLLQSVGGLVALKGKWVEVDRDKLGEALEHWKKVERDTRESGLSFYDGMRLLAGVPRKQDAAASADQDRDWIGLTAGTALEETLRKLRAPESLAGADPPGLRAQLRHYQQTGVSWLRLVTGLGLGACLADDMGLGKTVQVIGLLLHRKSIRTSPRTGPGQVEPSRRAGLAPRELEGRARQVRTHALVPDRAPVGEHNQQAPNRGTRRSRTRSTDHDLRHVIAHRVAAAARLGPRHSRRSPGDQELGHAAIADRQGAEGGGPCRHDGHPGRESPVRSLVAVRFSQPRPARRRQDVRRSGQANGGQIVVPAAPHPRRALHPAPAQDRQASHRRPARKGRDVGLLHAEPGAGRPL